MSIGVIFAGLTLSKAEIEEKVGRVLVLPPVKAGDIIHVCRIYPPYILIIDGAFEACASVWHKEILYALSLGLPVIGASSMGALRAAELDDCGMVGIGLIYDSYKQGILIDDDEVAVKFTIYNNAFTVLSDPMINVRKTIDKALEEKVITLELSSKILNAIKAMDYRDRSIKAYLQSMQDIPDAAVFLQWLELGGYVDQKKADAYRALDYLASCEHLNFTVLKVPYLKTILFYSLHTDSNCSIFPYENDLLPQKEREVIEVFNTLSGAVKPYIVLAKLVCLATIFHDDHSSEQEMLSFLKRIIAHYDTSYSSDKRLVLERHISLIFENEIIGRDTIGSIAALWLFFLSNITLGDMHVSQHEKLVISKKLRIKNKLLTTDSMMAWLANKSIKPEEYDNFIEFSTLFDYIINCNNLTYLLEKSRNTHWLRLALILSDLIKETI